MKNALFCDAARCGSRKNRCFGVMYRLYYQVGTDQRVSEEAVRRHVKKTIFYIVTAVKT
jgi:hypothetical protein